MIRRLPSLLSLVVLALLSWGSTWGADPQAAHPQGAAPRAVTPASDFSRGWLLVRLRAPLAEPAADKGFALVTGRAGLDLLIAKSHVQKIEHALAVSGRAPLDPEAFRRHGLDRTYKFHVPEGSDIPSLVERFSHLPEVELAEPDYIGDGGAVVPNDPFFPNQWGLDQISDADVDAPEAWGLSVGARTIIAILDTGADLVHEDLAAKLLPGYDFANNDAIPADDHGHGTNVSSVASAVTNNSRGIAGSCWNCSIMPLKVLDATNSGFYSWWADAMVYATDHKAQVINLSAGGFSPSAVLLAGVQYAYDAGVIHVSITHNDNSHLVRYPGNYHEPITVGATNSLDQRAAPLCFSPTSGSNYGSRTDVVAPGNLIVGAALGGGYNQWCGTSQAAPLVTGLVGVMETVDPSLGREEARHLVASGAEDQVGLPSEDTPGWDIFHGWGRVNMDRTLQGTLASMTLQAAGQPATGLSYKVANPLAASYDFIRADQGALVETADGVDLGQVVCLENDSPNPDTTGNEDPGVPALGKAFIYLSRFAAAGPGSYGGSSSHRDRKAGAGDCAACGDHALQVSETCDGSDIGGQTCQSQGFQEGLLACATTCQAFDTSGCSTCGNGVCEPRGGRVELLGPMDHFSKGLAILPPTMAVVSISRDDSVLRQIDIATGATKSSVTMTLPGKIIQGGNGLAYDPISGRLYGLLRLSGQPGRQLVTIDPATGLCTSIGDTGANFASIAFDAGGTLYGLTGDGAAIPEALFKISTLNATTTFLVSLGSGTAGEALGFNPMDGLLYRASGFGTQNVDEILQKVVPATLAVSPVFLKGDDYSEAEALVFEGSGIFLLADYNTDLFRVFADGEDCLSCPQDCAGIQSGNPADFFCCGDGDGRVPVTCSDPRCTSFGPTCN